MTESVSLKVSKKSSFGSKIKRERERGAERERERGREREIERQRERESSGMQKEAKKE